MKQAGKGVIDDVGEAPLPIENTQRLSLWPRERFAAVKLNPCDAT
jgi:hypothetical protein